jgi:hypothetical protein
MSYTVALGVCLVTRAQVQQSEKQEAAVSKTDPVRETGTIIAEVTMALEVRVLEQAWLKAETIVDRTRSEAMRAAERLIDTREKAANGNRKEIVGRLTTVETTVQKLRARHAAAERQANELFDRLQAAKSQGEVHA